MRKALCLRAFCICDRERIRTSDRLLRRQMLYPAELRDQSQKTLLKKNLIQSNSQVKFPGKRTARCFILVVGVAGFEPAASCSQSRRDNRATLHPEIII